MRKKKKKEDIIPWNKVLVSKKVWDRLSPGTQIRIHRFVEVIDEKGDEKGK